MTDLALASGIDTGELDPAVRPQDDLFRHVNGKWIARTEIPADKSRWGSFYVLAEEAEKAVREIIIDAQSAEPGTEQRKIGDLYASFMNEARAEELEATPIEADLASVDHVTSIPALLGTLGRLERAGISGAFQLYVDNDPGNPERYLVFVEQGGLGLPDESYYREETFASVREAYATFIERMFRLAGYADAAQRAKRVFTLETDLAAHHWDNVATRDSQKTYNLKTWGQVSALVAGADLDLWLTGLAAPAGAFEEVVVREPSFLTGLAATLTASRLDAWRDWLRWQIIRSSAAYLSSDFVEANFDFYGRTLSGTPQLRDRWKRAVSLVEGSLGEAVGKVYVERHFKPSAKESMDVLVGYLVDAYRDSISTLDWMTAETRERALEKLDKFTPKIGYPVKWRDYGTLAIDPGNLVGNVRATSSSSSGSSARSASRSTATSGS
jgi:putative endopeptidase